MQITIKDFLRQYPAARVDLMTVKGLILLQPWQGSDLLAENGSNTRLRVSGTKETVVASAILDHVIYRVVHYPKEPGHLFLLTNPPHERDTGNYVPCVEYEQTSFIEE